MHEVPARRTGAALALAERQILFIGTGGPRLVLGSKSLDSQEPPPKQRLQVSRLANS